MPAAALAADTSPAAIPATPQAAEVPAPDTAIAAPPASAAGPAAEAVAPAPATAPDEKAAPPEAAAPAPAATVAAVPDAAVPVSDAPTSTAADAVAPVPVAPAADTPPASPESVAIVKSPPVRQVGQGGLPLPAEQPARLTAAVIRYEGGVIVAEGNSEAGDPGVIFESGVGIVRARRLRLDTIGRVLTAEGPLTVERTLTVRRRDATPGSVTERHHNEVVTETLRGERLEYDFNTQKGSLDHAVLEMSSFTLSTRQLLINGRHYTAHDVVLRPGGLTEAERKIYGTPPFTLRAKKVDVEVAKAGSNAKPRAVASGAGLYFKNTRILPVPSYILKSATSSDRNGESFSLIPRLSINSVDKFLLTTTMRFPLSAAHPSAAAINADIGISARIGLRGGASLDSVTSYGTFGLRARVHDIVTTQLTNRIVLDRLPEITYGSPMLPMFSLPGGRKAGLLLGATMGRLSERTVGGGGGEVNATRSQLEVLLTTRAVEKNGPYLELFGRVASYTRFAQRYRNTGFEVGYYGKLMPRVHGLFSYRSTSLSGATPFQFDQVEIARELRSTFDIQVTPRYLIPIDLRYDLDLGRLRDERFGILRNYKNFAYGLTYQTAQHDLRLEIRNGF